MRGLLLGFGMLLAVAGGAAGEERKGAARPQAAQPAALPAAPGEKQLGLSAYVQRRSYGCSLHVRVEHTLSVTLDIVGVAAELRSGDAGKVLLFVFNLVDPGRARWDEEPFLPFCPSRDAWLQIRRLNVCPRPEDCAQSVIAIAPRVSDRRLQALPVRITLEALPQ